MHLVLEQAAKSLNCLSVASSYGDIHASQEVQGTLLGVAGTRGKGISVAIQLKVDPLYFFQQFAFIRWNETCVGGLQVVAYRTPPICVGFKGGVV